MHRISLGGCTEVLGCTESPGGLHRGLGVHRTFPCTEQPSPPSPALPSSSSPTENTQDGYCKCGKTTAPIEHNNFCSPPAASLPHVKASSGFSASFIWQMSLIIITIIIIIIFLDLCKDYLHSH